MSDVVLAQIGLGLIGQNVISQVIEQRERWQREYGIRVIYRALIDSTGGVACVRCRCSSAFPAWEPEGPRNCRPCRSRQSHRSLPASAEARSMRRPPQPMVHGHVEQELSKP